MDINVIEIPVTPIHVEPIITEINVATAGATGKSAYEAWLNDGHTGTLEDFFSYLGGGDDTNFELIFLTTILL